MSTKESRTEKAHIFFLKQTNLLVRHPILAVSQSMKAPRPLLLALFFLTLSLCLTFLILPSLMSGTEDLLQTANMGDHISADELTAITQLTPLRRTFAATLFTFFSIWSVIIQAFLLYLFFTLAKYPGLYREYFSACLTISFYDTILPMLLSLIIPSVPFSSLHLAQIFPSLPPLLSAFLQPIVLFSLVSLFVLGFGIIQYSEQPRFKTWKVIFVYIMIRTLFFGAVNLFFS